MIFVKYQHESTIGIHESPPSQTPLHPTPPLQVVTEHRFWVPSNSKFSPATYFTYVTFGLNGRRRGWDDLTKNTI